MVTTLLVLLGLAMLGVEIAYHADLAYQIKKLMYLLPEHQNVLNRLKTPKIWKVLHWSLMPMAIPCFIWYEFNKLINCPYCQSFWYGFIYSIIFANLSLIISIAFGGLTIVFVLIIEKLINL